MRRVSYKTIPFTFREKCKYLYDSFVYSLDLFLDAWKIKGKTVAVDDPNGDFQEVLIQGKERPFVVISSEVLEDLEKIQE